MKNKFMKKLAVLFTAATLACSSAPAYAAVPAVTETVQVEAATATKLDATLKKQLDKVIKAQKFTKKTTNKQKLQKLFNYTKRYKNYKSYMGVPSAAGWEYQLAKEMFQIGGGSCYHDAAAFAFLAKRATGLPVRICVGKSNAYSDTDWQVRGRHGWVEIKISGKWYTFDTNANRYSKKRKGKWFMQKRSTMEGKVYKTEKTYNVNF